MTLGAYEIVTGPQTPERFFRRSGAVDTVMMLDPLPLEIWTFALMVGCFLMKSGLSLGSK
jgi:hypothetical protein